MLPALALFVLGACDVSGGDSSRGPGVDVALRAYSGSGEPAEDEAIRRAVAVLEARLKALGATGSVTATPDAGRIRVRVYGADSPRRDRIVALVTRAGELEFYALERNLVPPSVDSAGFPVATQSLYELLVGRQSPAREHAVESWYLFDAERKLAAGPSPTKELLLTSGPLLGGWRILGVPPRTAVLECGIGEIVCPGVQTLNPERDSYYLIRFEPPDVPELDGSDVKAEATRHELDPNTGEPIVIMEFVEDGAAEFEELTRDAASRGRRLSRTLGGGQQIYQHFAIVLDREIKSWPSIDWQQYPDGISGEHGVQISGLGNVQEAEDLAAVVQAGALQVRVEVVSRTPFG